MIFKQGQLVAILGCSQALESKYLDPINAACTKFNINTMLRLAAFIAQVGHESGRLATTVENLNYSADGLVKTWPSRFTAASAAAVARQPQKIANIVYASRMGNGNEASGDGWKYRGRGLIQVTGKSNYDAYSQASGFNAVANPDALAEAVHASMSAGWFWDSKGLNQYADRSDFSTITKRINGGTNGQADRELLYKKAIIVLSGGVPPKDDVVDKAPMPAPPDGAPTSSVSNDKTPGAQNSSIVEPRAAQGSESKSKYPWNFVNVSRSGHISEVDDTPGYERLNMTHRTGSYWEIDNTGTYTIKSILDAYKLTKYDSYDYVGGNYTQQVKGQSYIQSNGDMVIKCGGVIYFTTNKVQMNVGMLAVSGEINAPNINATIFAGMSGLAFGDMLAKEAMVAYDIKKGKAPMLGQSLGFKSAPGATEAGSADGLMPNKLDKQSPSGTPWITNGISTAAGVVTVAAMAAGVADLFKKDTPSKELENAINSAASDIDKAATQSSKETPVFVKHVSFAKPTLISQSTTLDKPDPSLYVNNLHTIVSSTGKGRLHMSNGVDWIPVGDAAAADHDYTDEQIAIVIDRINQNEIKTTDQILAESRERAAAVLNEATQRQRDIEEEARARQQQITSGLLSEAVARGAAIQAESIIRQNAEESLSNRILELTASSSAEIAAAISEERQARTTAIEAEAFKRETLAAKVDQNTASISDEVITRSNETSALSSRITTYIASNDANIASFKTEINAKVDDQGNALSSRIDTQTAANESNKAAIISESTARTTADSALSTRIDTVFASTDSNRVAIQSEVTARTNGDTALGQRIDTLTATVTGTVAGVNLFANAGFIDGDNTADGIIWPSYWRQYYYNTPESVFKPSIIIGVDGYKAIRMGYKNKPINSWLGINYTTTLDDKIIRNGVEYIYAVRARASSEFSVGRGIILNATNHPHTSFIYLSRPALSFDWDWTIAKVIWNNPNDNLRDFHISIDSDTIGDGSFDMCEPIVHEGSRFLGFNLGTDQRILINTATITSEQTVRANADSALSSRVDVVSASTTSANIKADAAQAAADLAKAQAAAANAEIANISSDNVLSKGEKPTVILEYTTLYNERTGIFAQADNLGVDRSYYASAFDLLGQYLNSLGNSTSDWQATNLDTPIVGSTFRQKFLDVYAARQDVLNRITDKVKALSDAGIAANSAAIVEERVARTDAISALASTVTSVSATSTNALNAANAAQTAANSAATQAATANSQIANIASDNILSRNEKPDVILQWQRAADEKTDIIAKAISLGVDYGAYDYSYTTLANYLNSIGPGTSGWRDLTVDSNIVGVDFRYNWQVLYANRQTLLNAIAAKAATLSTWDGVSGGGKPENNATVGANRTNFLATVGGDNLTYNSSFEKNTNGLGDGWSIYNNNPQSEPTNYTMVAGRTGGYAQEVSWLNNHFSTKGIFGPLCHNGWLPGKTYLISFWAKTTNLSSVSGMLITWNRYPESQIAVLNPNLSADWQRYSFLIKTAEVVEPLGWAFISVDYGSAAGNVQIDDLMTVEGDILPSYYASAAEAQQLANNAQDTATKANNLIANITSDNIISPNEKPDLLREWRILQNEVTGVINSADSYGVDRTAYLNAYNAVSAILTPINAELNNIPGVDIPIDGATLRVSMINYYTTKQDLLNRIADIALSRQQANAAGITMAQAAANAAQAAANAAQATATAANTEIGAISSDDVLSKAEKPAVLLQWQNIYGEVDGIRSQADAFGVSRVEYDTAYQNLGEYLYTLPPTGQWSDMNTNTVIVGVTFRSKFTSYYGARTNILNAITTRAKALADQGIATNAASIVNEATARTNGDQANATAIQTVSTTVAGHTSTISQQQSSIQGVQANYGIKINNNGYVSGFGLLSEPVNGNIVSAFNILADKFAIQAPNLNGGTPVAPFSVDSTTTPPTIAMNGLVRFGGSSDGTGGKNICMNSGPSKDNISSYYMGYNPAGALGPIVGYDPYRPIGGGGVYTRLSGTSSSSSDLTNSNNLNYYSVISGKKYELSIYINTHRCNAWCLVVWEDANGNYVGGNVGNDVGSVGAGQDIGTWGRSTWVGVAPAGAKRCYIAVRTQYLGDGYVDPYTFTTMWYFGEAGVNQTTASPWSPAGVTSINGGQIVTDTISAISSNIGLMRTATSGGRTEIEANVIRVYDDGNQLRVKMGRLT